MKKISAIAFLIACVFSSCTEEIPTQVVEETPQITLIQAPQTVYQFPAQPAGIHVRAVDAQGVADLAGVAITVKRMNGDAINTREMADDGQNGDILPGDGQFFTSFDTALTRNQTGELVLEAIARDKNQNLSASARDTVQVLAGVENRLPVITSTTAPQVVWVDSIYSPQFLASANHPGGLDKIRFVLLENYPPTFPQPARIDTLRDNGLNGDDAASDGIFGLRLEVSQVGCKRGYYTVAFRAVDVSGGIGSAVVQTLEVTRVRLENTPPRLSSLNAPLTISRSAVPNAYVLSIKAEDPNAGCDDAVARVFFNTFLPSGNPATGNPFAMRDDGQSGDTTAGDGRYSLTIQITPQSATGDYRFEFQAQDRSGALSDKIVHTITVTP